MTNYKELNHLIQHLHFNIEEPTVKASQRKYSDNIEESDEYIELLKEIHERHEKIKEYWQLLNKLIEINAVIGLVSKDS